MLIKELFSDYISDIPNSIGRGEVLKLAHSEKSRELAVFASYEQLQKYEYVMDFEKAMRNDLGIHGFTLNCRYTPALFGEKAMPEIVAMLRRRLYVVNGHLDKADYVFEDGTVTVNVNGAGYGTLKKAGVETEFEKLIREVFSVNVKVVLSEGSFQSAEDDYAERMAQIISSMPAPQEAPLEEGYPEGRDAAPVPKEPVITIDFKDLPILKDGAKLIKGRTIDSPVINISDITSKMSNITVWGDVFDYSEKEIRTKNGEKRVVSM
ncbi:MAG: hypothetical protein K2G87_03280, partial [Oscillospiraceae bacterium]|nr:hypothetical protein [Oscillospiraceae bacterium]